MNDSGTNIYANHAMVSAKIHLLHKMFLFYAWTYADIPLLIGRYGRKMSLSYRLHSLIMTAIIVITIIFEVAEKVRSIVLQNDTYKRHPAHVIGAWVIFIINIIQAVGGSALESFLLSKNNRFSGYKKYVRIVHGMLGVLVWATAKWQIFLQIDWAVISFGSHKPKYQFYIVSGICIPLAIFLEIKNRFNKRKAIPNTVREALHTGEAGSGKYIRTKVTPEQAKIVDLI